MSDRMSIREFIERFVSGEFESNDKQVEAGWYDWFCKDTSLKNKTKAMGNIIKKLQSGGKVDLDTMYVFFKNCCGIKLYDQFKICDLETGEVKLCIDIENGHTIFRYAVYGRFPEGDFWDVPYAEFRSSKELVEWLNKPFEFDKAKQLYRMAKDELNELSVYPDKIESDDNSVVATLRFVEDDEELLERLKELTDYDVRIAIKNDIVKVTFRRKQK